MRVLAWERGEECTSVKRKRKKTFGYHCELLSLKIDTCPHKVFWWREKKILRNSNLFHPLLPPVHSSLSSPSKPWGSVSLFPSHTSITLTVWPFQTTTGNFNWTDHISGQSWCQKTVTLSPPGMTTLICQAGRTAWTSEGTEFSLHSIRSNNFRTQLKLALSVLRGKD